MIVLTMMGNLGFIQNLRPPMSYYVMANYEYIYGVEYGEKFCEDYKVEEQPYDCQHTPGLYTWYFFVVVCSVMNMMIQLSRKIAHLKV